MNALIAELKTRARLRLNALKRVPAANVAEPLSMTVRAEHLSSTHRLRDSLNLVARDVGFQTWEQALQVLSGKAEPGDDMGSFWHAPRCTGLLNHWFASHEQAREALATSDQRVLVPYRRQFVVVDGNYVRELGMTIDDDAWRRAGRDLVRAYGSEAWVALCRQRLMASRLDAAGWPPV